MIAELPRAVPNRRDLVVSLHLLGRLAIDAARYADAERTLRRSHKLLEALRAESPEDPWTLRNLANVERLRGIALEGTRRIQEAEQADRRSVELSEALLAKAPGDAGGRESLAAALNNLGNLHMPFTLNKPAECEADYRRSIRLSEALVAEFPDYPAHREQLIKTMLNFARFLRTQPGRMPESDELTRRAFLVSEKLAADFPTVPDLRLNQRGI